MKYIRRANERGGVDMGWLKSQHSFSFGNYYDPKHMGMSVLRVINDDIVAPGQGFGTHGHRDMEIISYVIKGAVQHKDNQGNITTIPAGDIQRMSAGTGVSHSEYNPSNTDTLNFLQIWVVPKERGLAPSYEQKTVVQNGQLTPLVTPSGKGNSLLINQDADMYRLVLDKDETFQLSPTRGLGYLHIVSGEINTQSGLFGAGDAFAISNDEAQNISAQSKLEAIWFDLPEQKQ